MVKRANVYALLLMVISCTLCQGQNKTDQLTATIKSETNDEVTPYGPNRITRTIRQDRKGNIWIATFGGVFRYDGKSFTNVTGKVSSARFFSVLEDRKGNFWFSSVGSGVYYYDGKSFQHFTTKDGLANDQVIDIYEDKTGAIWFGTLSGASRYDGKSFQNYRMNEEAFSPDFSLKEGYPSKDHNDVNSIIEDKTGKFWIGTRGNACLYDGKTFTVLTHEGKPFTNVRTIIEDKKGHVWLAGSDGLWRYDGRIFTNFTRNFVGYVLEDRKGNIWTTSEGPQGWILSRYDGQTLSDKKPTVTEINPNEGKMLFGILEAKEGSIWFGADGVYRYDGKTVTSFKK
ncbi:ligand-binding sensor domain-containing protein [Larkinella terrae]|uniref:Histidine kinase n=1 Tax=Larkinella terrae TaxID=2025311 RepID=A0A7K0ECG5_9BACT|nr:two-component regulator propeller domain-containing protein [Larkinella terrae]MRS59667.1 histidine kinase [Larkinella terrae]